MYTVTKNDKVNTSSQEIHSNTRHIEFEHIKGKENILVNSLSRLRYLDLCEDNDPEDSGYEYGKSIFNMVENILSSLDSNQNVNNKFEIDSFKHFLNEKDLSNPRLQDTNTDVTDTNSLPCICNLGLEKIKQLQKLDEHIARIIDKCKSMRNDKIPYHLDEHGITYREIRDGPNVFHAIMIPDALQSYILYESHNALGQMAPPDCIISLQGIIIGRNCINTVTSIYAHVQNANK